LLCNIRRSSDTRSQPTTSLQTHFVQGHNGIEGKNLLDKNSYAEGCWRKMWTQGRYTTGNNLD